MTPHTPGPWEIESTHGITVGPADNGFVCRVRYATTAKQRDEAFANARLIAAAPDLLEALRTIAECNEESSRLPASDRHKKWCAKTAAVARTAIAKATGE
jgi:hypothetical protein